MISDFRFVDSFPVKIRLTGIVDVECRIKVGVS